MKIEFINAAGYRYHLEKRKVLDTDQTNVLITTTYDHSKYPDHHNTVLNVTLNPEEFDAFIGALLFSQP